MDVLCIKEKPNALYFATDLLKMGLCSEICLLSPKGNALVIFLCEVKFACAEIWDAAAERAQGCEALGPSLLTFLNILSELGEKQMKYSFREVGGSSGTDSTVE